MGISMFFYLEMLYNEDFYLDYVKSLEKVTLTAKVAFDIFMHGLYI